MKKHYYVITLLFFLAVSCVSEKIETEEDRISYNPEAIWVYDGDNSVLKGVIQELKNGDNRESLERRLLKNDVLWKNAEFLVIQDKKRILVPFLSIDKENVIGFLTLYRDSKGKIQYDMTVRSQVFSKNAKLPFWDSSIWAGYFMAYDKTILGKKNGNPGVMRKAIPKEELKALTSRFETICGNYYYESCVTVGGDCTYNGGEWWSSDCGGGSTYCTQYYKYECFNVEVPDNPNLDPNPNPDPGSGDSGDSGNNNTNDDNVPEEDQRKVIFNGSKFHSLQEFENFISSNETFVTNLPVVEDVLNHTHTTNAKMNITYFATLDFNAIQRLKKYNNQYKYELTGFFSDLHGWVVGISWSQDYYYYYDVIDNIAYIQIYGAFHYDLFVEGAGTVYSTPRHYEMKIDVYTGELLGITKK